jgi:hypothetical protein
MRIFSFANTSVSLSSRFVSSVAAEGSSLLGSMEVVLLVVWRYQFERLCRLIRNMELQILQSNILFFLRYLLVYHD